MAFKILNYKPEVLRIVGDKGNLIGLITELAPTRFRVEMMMRVDEVVTSMEAAVAFVRGAETALRAWEIIPKEKQS